MSDASDDGGRRRSPRRRRAQIQEDVRVEETVSVEEEVTVETTVEGGVFAHVADAITESNRTIPNGSPLDAAALNCLALVQSTVMAMQNALLAQQRSQSLNRSAAATGAVAILDEMIRAPGKRGGGGDDGCCGGNQGGKGSSNYNAGGSMVC